MKPIVAITLLLLFLSCKNQGTKQIESVTGDHTNVSVIQAKEMLLAKKVVALDVRTPEEITQGKIPGAAEIDFRSKDFSNRISRLDKSTAYLVYCKSGGRSAKAAKQMSKAGFSQTYNMLGGFSEWKSNE